jgi:hypothetical protein
VGGNHLEVVPGRPIKVDDDGPETEGVSKDLRDSSECDGGVILLTQKPEQLEQAAEVREL